MKKKGVNRAVPKKLTEKEASAMNLAVLEGTHRALSMLSSAAVAEITKEGAESDLRRMRRFTLQYNIFNLAALVLGEMVETMRADEKKPVAPASGSEAVQDAAKGA